ncbi:hypothetical protein WN943_008359 [Citrus x changshan-huyou]
MHNTFMRTYMIKTSKLYTQWRCVIPLGSIFDQVSFESYFVIFADNWASQAQAVKRVRTMASQETVKQLEDCSVSKSVIFQETF